MGNHDFVDEMEACELPEPLNASQNLRRRRHFIAWKIRCGDISEELIAKAIVAGNMLTKVLAVCTSGRQGRMRHEVPISTRSVAAAAQVSEVRQSR